MNTLYYGDNLEILREHIKDESVDLIYLDPPFNSNANYNLLFKSPTGADNTAQVIAFEDTWHWGEQAEREFAEVMRQANTDAAALLNALRSFLHENDMMAYLVMMTNRLLELHRVLKPTGSIYLHCDPTASHYLKLIMDAVFGKECFLGEIIWKRTSAHNDPKKPGRIHDTLLFYAKSRQYTWNQVFQPYDEEYVERYYRYSDKGGRRYSSADVAGAGQGPARRFGDRVLSPPPGRHWAWTQEKIDELVAEGHIFFTDNGFPRLKRYLDDMPGMPLQDIWADKNVQPVVSWSTEKLGYPTQKPLALLERIISASSNPGNVVLDPFCGCGTAVHAAQALGRQWIGIDITHLAVSLIEKRLKDAFPGIQFAVEGTPKDVEAARDLASRGPQGKYQFQWWACSLVNAQPYQGKKKGADTGIDGLIFFQDDAGTAKKVIVNVKGGENVGVTMVKDLIATVEREKAAIGLFVTLATPTKPLLKEAATAGFYHSPGFRKDYPKIQVLTIEGLLKGTQHAQYPDLSQGGLTFKKAQKHGLLGGAQLLLEAGAEYGATRNDEEAE